MSCSWGLNRTILSFVALIGTAVPTSAANKELLLGCIETSQTVFSAIKTGNAPLIIPSASKRYIKIDLIKKKAIIADHPSETTNNPAFGEIQLTLSKDHIQIFNKIPTTHPDAITRLTITVDRATRVFSWKDETLDESNNVVFTQIGFGICDTAAPKF